MRSDRAAPAAVSVPTILSISRQSRRPVHFKLAHVHATSDQIEKGRHDILQVGLAYSLSFGDSQLGGLTGIWSSSSSHAPPLALSSARRERAGRRRDWETDRTTMKLTGRGREEYSKLTRGLGLLDATMIVIGSMIGSGIFIVSAEWSRLVGTPGWLLAAWAIAGLMTITGALCCAEMAAMMPRAGGQYVFLREAYGPAAAFLFGWSLLFVIQTGTIAAVAIAFANFAGVLTERVPATTYIIAPIVFGRYGVSLSTQQFVAVATILLLTLTNTRGLRLGRLIQNTFTITKTGALGALIIIGLVVGWNSGSAAHTSSWWNPWANGWNSKAVQPDVAATGVLALTMFLGRAMIGPLFAQSAWNNVTFTGGEVREPGRNLPRAPSSSAASASSRSTFSQIWPMSSRSRWRRSSRRNRTASPLRRCGQS